jgi:glycopeptide antibiotics resistance protein
MSSAPIQPEEPRSTSQSRARLSLVLLLYFLGLTTVIVLAPFRFSIPSHPDIAIVGDSMDVVAGALLFIPLGFLFPLTRQGPEPSPTRVVALGLLLAALMQAMRLFEPDQVASVAGVFAGGLGAGAGALFLRAVNRRLRLSARLTGRLSLELPLVALIYLLVPLLVAASRAALDDPLRMLALVPLCLLGARLMSAVQEHHFGPGGVFRNRDMVIVAAGWTALGVFPVAPRQPLVALGLVLLASLATAAESSIPAVRGGAQERRFEGDALRGAIPYVAVYFVTAAFLPLALGLTDWRVALGLTGSGDDRAQQVVHLLEPIASLAVLGYMIAEARGRRELSFRSTASRIAAESAGVALAIEISRGFQRDAGASVIELGLMIAAGVVGAGIYHKQRDRVRWFLIHRPGAPVDRAVSEKGLVRIEVR